MKSGNPAVITLALIVNIAIEGKSGGSSGGSGDGGGGGDDGGCRGAWHCSKQSSCPWKDQVAPPQDP